MHRVHNLSPLSPGVDPETKYVVDSWMDPGMDSGLESHLESGEDLGVDSGVDSGMDPGADPGVDSGVHSGLEPGVDSGEDSGVDSGRIIARDSDFKSDRSPYLCNSFWSKLVTDIKRFCPNNGLLSLPSNFPSGFSPNNFCAICDSGFDSEGVAPLLQHSQVFEFSGLP